jgi:chromate reductase
MKLLAISGSLRTASINSAFCRVAVRLAPSSLQINVFADLGGLPPFNPDLEPCPPSTVLAFRTAVGDADALIIASPEYAHGVAGALKNALDWLVSFEGTVYKPVALINTSTRAHHAYDALREILQTMSLYIVNEASVTIPLSGACITEAAMIESPNVRHAIRSALEAMAVHFQGDSTPAPIFPLE